MAKSRGRPLKSNKAIANPPPQKGKAGLPSKGFDYELSREERIKENQLRMEKLGLLNLSRNLNHARRLTAPRKPKPPSRKTFAEASRRSSRLTTKGSENAEIIKKEVSEDLEDPQKSEDLQTEVYTEEHVKLLGDCKTTWTLHVDGFDEDGKRILGRNKCHQCRCKTSGHLTECSKCKLDLGQLCGDCLYMRYGENIIEAKENKDWVCPACRGICNCSSCRRANGWRPTGPIYRKVVALGYKSVAHFLIKTWGPHANLEGEAGENSIYRATSILTLPPVYNRKVKKTKVDRKRKRDDNSSDQDYDSESDVNDDADESTEDDQDNDYAPDEKEEDDDGDDELTGYEFEIPDIVSGQQEYVSGQQE